MAQAAGPGTGDPYVGGPGIKAIGLAASPPATQVLAILVQGAAGQVIVANAVWARAGVSAKTRLLEAPFTFILFLLSFFSSNLSAPCPEVTVSCSLLSSLCRKQALQLVFGGRLLLRGGNTRPRQGIR